MFFHSNSWSELELGNLRPWRWVAAVQGSLSDPEQEYIKDSKVTTRVRYEITTCADELRHAVYSRYVLPRFRLIDQSPDRWTTFAIKKERRRRLPAVITVRFHMLAASTRV